MILCTSVIVKGDAWKVAHVILNPWLALNCGRFIFTRLHRSEHEWWHESNGGEYLYLDIKAEYTESSTRPFVHFPIDQLLSEQHMADGSTGVGCLVPAFGFFPCGYTKSYQSHQSLVWISETLLVLLSFWWTYDMISASAPPICGFHRKREKSSWQGNGLEIFAKL